MKKNLILIITALILLPCIAGSQEDQTASSTPVAVEQPQQQSDVRTEEGSEDQSAPETITEAEQNTLKILKSIVKSKATLKQRMDEKKNKPWKGLVPKPKNNTSPRKLPNWTNRWPML